MAVQLLSMGVIGVRLLDCILTSRVTYPDELADQIVHEINHYLASAPLNEKPLLFHLACEVHEALNDRFDRIDSLQARRDIADVMGFLVFQARMTANQSR